MTIQVIDMTRREPCQCDCCTMERWVEDLADDVVESLLMTLANEIDAPAADVLQGWPATPRMNLVFLLAQAEGVLLMAERLGYDRTQPGATVCDFYDTHPAARAALLQEQAEP